MLNNLASSNLPLINNLLKDTWGHVGYNNEWVIVSSVDLTSATIQEINSWYIDTVQKTLACFSTFARPWKIVIIPHYESEGKLVSIRWQENTTQVDFINEVINCVQNYSFLIQELEIKVDLNVFVKTLNSSDILQKNWIRCGDEIVICGELKDIDCYMYLSLKHTLFDSDTCELEKDNNELHFLNQPLLEQSLKFWEYQFGSITEFDGYGSIYKYGFLPHS